MTEPEREYLNALAQSRSRAQTLQLDNLKRLLLSFIITAALMVFCLIMGPRWTIAYAVVAVIYVAWGSWAIRGGRCVICNRRTSMAFPPQPYVPRKWWDLRYPSRKGVTHVCMDHSMMWMQQRVEVMMMERKINE